MNKLFIVFLAVCLVSVHAFVKRETEAAQPGQTFQKQVDDFVQNAGNQLKEFLDPEKIKKSLNEGIDTINKAISDLQPKKDA